MDKFDGIYRRESDPVAVAALIGCVFGAVLTVNYYASVAILFVLGVIFWTYHIWQNKKRGVPIVYVDNGEFIFLEKMDTPNRHKRIKISDLREISVAGLPDDKRFRFTLKNGEAITFRPYFERRYSDKVIEFLKSECGDIVPIIIQGPLDPLEEMRGNFD